MAFVDVLKRIYHNFQDPGSFGGIDRLLRRVKQLHVASVNFQDVVEYLGGEQDYTLHKPARRHYQRNHIYVGGIDTQWQADLADMQGLACQNDGMRYLLTVIDVFSKFAWVEPVKTKDAPAVTAAFRNMLNGAAPRRPRRLQTDKGKEFFNASFANLMRHFNIQHFSSDSDQNTAVVKRFNRTIKKRLWTHMSDKGTVRWLEVLQKLVVSYNHSYHRSIGMPPAEITINDENRIWARLYGDGDTHNKRRCQ